MVKQLHFHGNIEFADAQKVFSYLYEDETFAKRYHKEANADPSATVTRWTEDGMREVSFQSHLHIPRILEQIVGGDTFQLTEFQKCTKDGNIFRIHSDLSTDLHTGASWVTTGDTILSPAAKGCAVDINLTLEFKTKWLGRLAGIVEEYAEKHAEYSFKRWLNIARIFCQEKMDLARETSLIEDEFFYDTDDTLFDDSLSIAEDIEANSIGNVSSNATALSTLQEVIVQEAVRNISLHTHLEKMDKTLLKIENDIFFLRSFMERSQCSLYLRPWSLYGLGIATSLSIVVALGLFYMRQVHKLK